MKTSLLHSAVAALAKCGRTGPRLPIAATTTLLLCVSVISSRAFAANTYPFRIINGTTTGIVDELQITNSTAATLSITNLPGGGRRAQLGIYGSGGGGSSTNGLLDSSSTNSLASTNWVNANFLPIAGTNSLVAQASLLAITNSLADKTITNGLATTSITNGLATTSITNGLTTAAVTNGLADSSITNGLAGAGVTNGLETIAAANVLTNGLATIGITNSLVAQASLLALTNSLVTLSSIPSITNSLADKAITNGLATLSITNPLVAQTSLLALTNPLVAQASLPVITNSLVDTSHALTNGGTQPLFWNGTAVVSNNATFTGSVNILGPLSAASIVGISTGTVASVNGLISNVTIAATGNATATSAVSSNGGTITINVPLEFAVTNTSTVAPLWWSTKYGAMRVSNVWGMTFINCPDLSTLSNENATLTDYFTSTTTGAWINVNVSGAWTVANTNNHLLFGSSGEANGAGNYIVKAIPNTNQSWRCRVLIDNISDNSGTTSYNADFGVSALEDTNGVTHSFVLHRNSSLTPAFRGFSSATPQASWQSVETATDNNIPLVNNFYMQTSWLWMQVSYDGVSNLTYSAAYGEIGLPPILKTLKVKNSQTVKPKYIGMGACDANNTGPQFILKAFVFEQP